MTKLYWMCNELKMVGRGYLPPYLSIYWSFRSLCETQSSIPPRFRCEWLWRDKTATTSTSHLSFHLVTSSFHPSWPPPCPLRSPLEFLLQLLDSGVHLVLGLPDGLQLLPQHRLLPGQLVHFGNEVIFDNVKSISVRRGERERGERARG